MAAVESAPKPGDHHGHRCVRRSTRLWAHVQPRQLIIVGAVPDDT